MTKTEQRLDALIRPVVLNEIASGNLPGLSNSRRQDCFISQLIDSCKRVELFTRVTALRSSHVTNPHDPGFDPIKACTQLVRNNNHNEAIWLSFLVTHFGKHSKSGWGLLKTFYGGPAMGREWSFVNVQSNIPRMKLWLNNNQGLLKTAGQFGNHRKFESLEAYKTSIGTGATIETFCAWAGNNPIGMLNNVLLSNGRDPHVSFQELYQSLSVVMRFGRTAKFDFLCMIGKLGIAPIEPDSSYLVGSTGPKTGAGLLLSRGAQTPTKSLETQLDLFANKLGLPYAMQIVEDAVCNWQKSPNVYVRFR